MRYAIHIHDIPLYSMFLQAHAQSYRLDHRRNNNKKSTRATTANSSGKMNWVLFKVCKIWNKMHRFQGKWDNEEPKMYDMNWMSAMCILLALIINTQSSKTATNLGCSLFFTRNHSLSPEAQSPSWRNSILKFKSPLTAIDHVFVQDKINVYRTPVWNNKKENTNWWSQLVRSAEN